MACLPGRATRSMSLDLGLVALTPQTGHCAPGRLPAFSSGLLGKGWRAGEEKGPHPLLGSLAVLRQPAKPWWKERAPPLSRDWPASGALPESLGAATISEIYFGMCSRDEAC